MEDANFLFVAPIRPRTVLLYGLVKTAKAIVIGSWFMVFQIQWMRGSFGISIGGVILAALGYILLTLVCQVLNLFIYAFTNANARRKIWAKIILVAVFMPAIVIFCIAFLDVGTLMGAINGLMASPVLDFTPIVGWASAGITALILGEALTGMLLLGLLVLAGVVFFCAVFFGSPDYYEDVLGATESAFEKVRAVQEDSAAAIGTLSGTNRDIKIKATGIGRGRGADTFFYKHIRESFRANYLGLWGIPSIIVVIGAVVWAFFSTGNPEFHLLTVLITLSIIEMFGSGYCRGILETYNHYIYMVPDRPFTKWVWANMEGMFQSAVEAIIIFVATGIIVGAPIWTTFAALVTSIVYAFYLSGISLASMRVTGTKLNTMLLLVIYFAVVLIPLVPGIIGAVIVYAVAPYALSITLALFTVSAWMLLVGIGCFALSKGALHNSDMPVMPKA